MLDPRKEWITSYDLNMKPIIKERWIAALRSGVYSQNTLGFLRTEAGYSSLGVLCDIFAKDNGLEWKEDFHLEIDEEGNTQLIYRLEGTEEIVDLPTHVAVWAGLDFNNIPVVCPHLLIRLEGRQFPLGITELDDEGWDFNRIAQVIEQYF